MSNWLDEIKWDADGLVPAIAQDHKTGRVLMMAWMNREALELTAAEICATLDISVSNLHVQLYRARLRLRECLENRWFMGEQQ